ncbi:MAG: hypothetical protein ABIP50_01945 [Candidatus Saccharimonadales bacterium]
MQDIDFDELDRAVSSTMEPSTPTPAPSSDAVTVSDSAPKPVLSGTPAARRSSGRFMDMVHSSSDMRNGSPVPERSAPRPVEVSAPEHTPEPSVERSTDWPDPLDFHGFDKEDEAEVPAPVPETPELELIEDDLPEPKPLETPFLSDAKVEKRPLGAFSSSETPATDPFDDLMKVEAEETPEVKKDEPELLLAASDEDLLTALTAENEADDKEETPMETPIVEQEAEPVVEETPESPALQQEEVVRPVETDTAPAGPTSIHQQYKEQPSTTNQPSGAIYDTEAYHQPLAYVAKKKSGGLVILWIVGLIIIGGGIGAAIYFFVLPLL